MTWLYKQTFNDVTC